jgi:hypothetical protein
MSAWEISLGIWKPWPIYKDTIKTCLMELTYESIIWTTPGDVFILDFRVIYLKLNHKWINYSTTYHDFYLYVFTYQMWEGKQNLTDFTEKTFQNITHVLLAWSFPHTNTHTHIPTLSLTQPGTWMSGILNYLLYEGKWTHRQKKLNNIKNTHEVLSLV